jgi:hypothetical protein
VHVARVGGKRDVCGILVGKPEVKRPVGKPGYKWGIISTWGHAVAQSVEALRYKPKGRGFDSR